MGNKKVANQCRQLVCKGFASGQSLHTNNHKQSPKKDLLSMGFGVLPQEDYKKHDYVSYRGNC